MISVGGFISGEYTTLGYYGGIGLCVDYNKFSLAFSPVMDYSKAVSMFDGPFGFVFNLSYYPTLNREKTFNHYINSIYRISLTNRYSEDSDVKYNKTHEILLGYGIEIKMYKGLYLSSSINAGMFIDKVYSDYEKEYSKNKGFDTVIQLRLIYRFIE